MSERDPALADTHASGEGSETVASTVASADAPLASPATPIPLPEIDPERYQRTTEVGRGGIGRVVEARDRILERTVAIKELVDIDDSSRRRFVREAMITARLQHPSIVPIYEAGHWPDRAPFYAMKLVAGRPLSREIAGKRTLEERLSLVPVVLAVADALAYAHAQRIIHRDLKPHNVLVGAYGETIVIDWGLAKDLSQSENDAPDELVRYGATRDEQTMAGVVMGTPAYMAPEQAEGDAVDERADVYAIGAMLYETISGAMPHAGKSGAEMMDAAIAGKVVPLVEREPRTPPDLAAIVAKAMARDPAARYPTARELADDLRRFTTGQLVGAHDYTLGQRVRRFIAKHRAVAAVAAAAVIVLAIYGTWSIRRIVDERSRARASELVAQSERAAAVQQLSRLLEDRGRTELLANDHERALPLLVEALRHGDRPSLRFLLSRAATILGAEHVRTLHPDIAVRLGEVSHDQKHVAIAQDVRQPIALTALDGSAPRALQINPDDRANGYYAATHLRFSPDDRLLAIVAKRLPLWKLSVFEVTTGKLVREIALAGDDRIDELSFFDSNHVALARPRGIEVFDVTTATPTPARHAATTVAIDPDSSRALTWNGGTATVLDLATGASIASWKRETWPGRARLLLRGPSLAIVDESAPAELRDDVKTNDLELGRDPATLELPAGAALVRCGGGWIHAEPDGTLVRTLFQWSRDRYHPLSSRVPAHATPIVELACSRDDTRLASIGNDGAVRVWDARVMQVLANVPPPPYLMRRELRARTLSISADLLVIGFYGHEAPNGIQQWRLPASPIRTVSATVSPLRANVPPPEREDTLSIRLSPAGDRALLLPDAREPFVVDRDGRVTAILRGHGAIVVGATWSPDGARIATISTWPDRDASQIRVFDSRTSALAAEHPYAGNARVVGFAKDGSLRVGDGDAFVDPIAKRVLSRSSGHPLVIDHANGRALELVGEEIFLVDIETGARIAKLDATYDRRGGSHALSTDLSKVLLLTGGVLTVIDTSTGKRVYEQPTLARTASFVQDSQTFMTFGDREVNLWKLGQTTPLATIRPPRRAEFATLLPDRERIATFDDHGASLWDLRGNLLAFAPSSAPLWQLAFTPDSTRAFMYASSSLQLWDIGLEQRDLATLDRLVRCRIGWRYVDDRLVQLPPDRCN